MDSRYEFRAASPEDLPVMFEIILRRMRWMDEVGIRQWNVTEYDKVYPLSYYEEKQRQGQVFVLYDRQKQAIVCAAVLKEEDERWPDRPPAFYLRNFASVLGESGVGVRFMALAEDYARAQGKRFFRLDASYDNPRLLRYYEDLGYRPVGSCVDGVYRGTRMEKVL